MKMEMYVLQVRPGCEEAAAQAIANHGYRVACPSSEMLIRYGGSWHTKVKLLFTQYIFVECELTDDDYYRIKSVPGVVRFLGFGNSEPLQEHEQAYINLLRNGGKPIAASKIYITSEGDMMILSGVLRQYMDSIVSCSLRQRRAKVRVTLLGKPHTITLPVTSI